METYSEFDSLINRSQGRKFCVPKNVNPSALSFEDILLVPNYSPIESRLNVSLKTRLTKHINLDIPICSTNMPTVTGERMAITMAKLGGAGFLHRFGSNPELLKTAIAVKDAGAYPLVVSMGVCSDSYNFIDDLIAKGAVPDAILVDIAHGDSVLMEKAVKWLKKNWPAIDVIAGNIVTKLATKRLCDLGVDGLRVGIGGGSQCLTRSITGHGMPNLQAIIDCYSEAFHYDVPIIADGGFKNGGQIVKALAFGASTVCLGRLLAVTSAAPNEIIDSNGKKFVEYYGLASTFAQEKHKNGLKKGTSPEGMASLLHYEGETEQIVDELGGAVRSGLTYSGCTSIEELREYAKYVIISNSGANESKI